MISKKIFILLSLIIPAIFSLFYFLDSKLIETFTVVYISASAIFLILCWIIFKIEITNKQLIFFLGIGIALRIGFVNFTPVGSDDVYRYMWDGRVQDTGINPYRYAPIDPALNFLHTDILPKKLNYIDMKTIYFPLSQWLFYTGYKISGENVWGYKLLLLVFEMFTFLSVFLLLKKLKLPLKFILFYVLCPLPIIHFAIDAHLDGFGLPLLLFAVYFYLSNKRILSYIFLGLSLTIKPIGLLFIPIFFLNEKGWSNKIKSAVIPLLAFFLQFIPYIINTNPFEAFIIYSKNWTFNGVVFNIIDYFMRFNAKTRIVCAVFLGMFLLPLYLSRRDILEKLYYSVILLMIFSPVVHPWYIAWLVVFLPIIPRWSGIVYAATSCLTAFTILHYQLYGVWNEYPLLVIFEYLPVIIILILELTENRYHQLKIIPSNNYFISFESE